jgi:hypothetical protein
VDLEVAKAISLNASALLRIVLYDSTRFNLGWMTDRPSSHICFLLTVRRATIPFEARRRTEMSGFQRFLEFGRSELGEGETSPIDR